MEAVDYFLPERLFVVSDELLEQAVGASYSSGGCGTLEADWMLEALDVVRISVGWCKGIVVGTL